MLSKGIMQEHRKDLKQFKTATGSPVTYAKLRKQKGLYYPMAKPHLIAKQGKLNHHHVAVVYSKMYGREAYENIDIWPDGVEFLKDTNAVAKLYENDDIPDTLEESVVEEVDDVSEIESSGDVQAASTDVHPHHHTDDRKHVTIKVTDADDEVDGHSSSAGDSEAPRPDSPSSSSQHSGQWPLKRSQSIDSRDNPFLPGGDLRKEAEDILSRATIIRDRFILNERAAAAAAAASSGASPPPSSPDKHTQRTTSNGSPKAHEAEEELPVTETMTTEVVQKSEASVVPNSDASETRHKENGQLDTENSLTPGSVKLDIVEDPKDRKKQKKCCTVM